MYIPRIRTFVGYNENMSGSLLFLNFSLWYYTRAFRDILSVWLNFLWLIVHYFSIPLLLRTFFSPWKRITDTYGHTGIEDFIGMLIMNLMTRIFGAIIRLCIIVCGLACVLLGVVGLFVSIVLWIGMPVILVGIFFYGIRLFTV